METINIQINYKCDECGAEGTSENLNALDTFESAQGYLFSFNENEFDQCGKCAAKRRRTIKSIANLIGINY